MWNKTSLRRSTNTSRFCEFTSLKSDERQLSSFLPFVLILPWILALFKNPAAAVRDARAVLLVTFLLRWRQSFSWLLHWARNDCLWAAFITAVPVFTTFKLLLSYDFFFFSSYESSGTIELDEPPFLRPLIFPCRTTHTRLFPQKHSFSYSYLFVGIPVGWRGPASNLLSADTQLSNSNKRYKQTWFNVEAEDYLERGSQKDDLAGKLREYLKAQGVASELYPYAYLVTSPRFLGFAFNPASFWYLYNQKKILAAMIVEVNNTFDERRLYFMQRTSGWDDAATGPSVFAHDWHKDFHVSPFNDRDGSYSLKAISPFGNLFPKPPRIDNTIVLKSPDGNPKIVARVFSTDSALEAGGFSKAQTLSFLMRWCWIGLLTNPRILREARVLWIKKLKVFYRPEVVATSIGRKETVEESELEDHFNQFLQHLVHHSGITIRYLSAAGPLRGTAALMKPSPQLRDNAENAINIKVLTPAFYSELVRYQSIKEVFSRRCFHAANGNEMLQISHPRVIESILDQYPTVTPDRRRITYKWGILGYLRHPSLAQAYRILINLLGPSSWFQMSTVQLAELDYFVINQCPAASVALYQQTAIKTLLADRFAFGLPSVLWLYGSLFWILLVYWAARRFQEFLMPKTVPSLGEILFMGLYLLSRLIG